MNNPTALLLHSVADVEFYESVRIAQHPRGQSSYE